MKNRVEGQSYNFGQLVGNGEDINSGSIGNLIAAGPGPIKHKTLDEIYNSDRYYSFKWEYDIITPVEDQNPYNSTNYVIVPFNSAPKDVTRKFRKVYPLTIKNILPEIGGITTGNILFKDPTTTNQFETKSAAGSGYINNEAFNNLNETINNEPNQQYSVKANSIIPYNNRDYNWYAGDFNPTTDTDFQINNGQKNLNAYYKGSQISNNAEASPTTVSASL